MPRVKKDPAARPAIERGIPEQVVDILLDVLAVDEDQLTLDSNLIEDLGADSLDVVEIAMSFEREYGKVISDATVERWEGGTVNDVLTSLRAMGIKV